MRNQSDWTPIEHEIAAELRRLPAHVPAECLQPEQLLDLIESTDRGQTVEARPMAHLAVCPACRLAYVEMQQAWNETALVRAAAGEARTSPSPMPRSVGVDRRSRWKSGQRWLPQAVAFGLCAASVAFFLWTRTSSEQLRRALRDQDARIAQLQHETQESGDQARKAQAAAQTLETEAIRLTKRLAQAHRANRPIQLARAEIDQSRLPALSDLATVGGSSRAPGPHTTQGNGDVTKPFAALYPIATRVTSDALRFHWEPVRGATTYKIEIRATEEGKDDRTLGGVVSGLGDAPPSTYWRDETALHEGETYDWKVTATDHLATALAETPWYHFQILPKDKRLALEAHLSSDPLRRALQFAQEGLYAQSVQELSDYRKVHPKDKTADLLEVKLHKIGVPLLGPATHP